MSFARKSTATTAPANCAKRSPTDQPESGYAAAESRVTPRGSASLGHSVATSNADVKALIANADSFTRTGFLVPLANDELLRWCLEQRLRIVYLLNLMSLGWYEQPRGTYLPSIGY